MDFFAQQEKARRQTRLLLIYFFLLVAVISLLFGVVPLFYDFHLLPGSAERSLADPASAGGGIVSRFFPEILLNGVIVAAVILLLSFFGYLRYCSSGGAGVAESMGGRLLTREGARSLNERRLLNVVEEMALAAGTVVPPVYMLDSEPSINAFAAGLTPESAVIGVTRGAVENFSRSELQGVVAHEFSHILNGDMRLNLRLAGMIFGLYCFFRVGYQLLLSSRSGSSRQRKGGGAPQVMLAALFFCLLGLLGVGASHLLRAAVSRRREYLADASAVQFTRDNNTIGGALKRLLAMAKTSSSSVSMRSPKAKELGYMMFSGAGEAWFNFFADHPPLEKRILAVDPQWDGSVERWLKEEEQRREQRRKRASALRNAEQAPAGRGRGIAAAAVVAALDRPAEGIDRRLGRQVKRDIPKGLRTLAVQGSTARLIPLLLAFDPNERNRRFLNASLSPAMLRLLFVWEKCELAAGQRLALLDLALPILKQMSAPQIRDYLDLVDGLVRADGKLILREWVVVAILHKNLDPQPLRSGQIGVDRALRRLVTSLAEALQNDVSGEQAIRKAKVLLGLAADDPLPPPPSWHELRQALTTLARQRPEAKKRLLQGFLTMINSGGRVSADALELFRAIATLLEVPVAPPEQETVAEQPAGSPARQTTDEDQH